MSATESVSGAVSLCWSAPPQIGPELLAALKFGPWADAATKPEALAELTARLRREKVDRPVIYIGTGTCGLGAGAGKVLQAIETYLKRERVEADVVQVGCIGLCSEEPLVDVQLPGRPRLAFSSVTPKLVPEILNAVLGGSLPRKEPLGQFSGAGEPWPGVPRMDANPFLARQCRVVLATSGLLDPNRIDEYIAWGG